MGTTTASGSSKARTAPFATPSSRSCLKPHTTTTMPTTRARCARQRIKTYRESSRGDCSVSSFLSCSSTAACAACAGSATKGHFACRIRSSNSSLPQSPSTAAAAVSCASSSHSCRSSPTCRTSMRFSSLLSSSDSLRSSLGSSPSRSRCRRSSAWASYAITTASGSLPFGPCTCACSSWRSRSLADCGGSCAAVASVCTGVSWIVAARLPPKSTLKTMVRSLTSCLARR